MADPDAFALPHSDVNAFLFGQIGIDAGGLELSVMSALAREGLDPWQEAARLARLPEVRAIDELARMIAAVPESQWPQPIATEIAARLVRLLPRRGGPSISVDTSGASKGAAQGINRDWLTLILLGIAILVGSAVGISSFAPNPPRRPPEAVPAAADPAQPPALRGR
jgi:hypothetical protein